MRTAFLIPIRGGSKGLMNKNMLYYAGKPLVCHVIDKIRSLGYLDDDIYVSTDSNQYVEDLRYFGVNVIKRDANLGLDNTATSEVVVDFLTNTILDEEVTLILCQATSPQMSITDLSQGIELFNKENGAVVSVSKATKAIELHSKMENGRLADLAGVDKNYRRQDVYDTYCPNGAFYISLKSEYLKSNSFFNNETRGYIMSCDNSLDIDTVGDFRNLLGQSYFNKVNDKDNNITFINQEKYDNNLFISDSRGVFYNYEGVTNLSVAGISAVKVSNMLGKYDNIDNVVIMLGVNDLRYGYEISQIVDALQIIKSKLSPKKFKVIKVLKTLYRYEINNSLIEDLNFELNKHFTTVELLELENQFGLKIKYSEDGLHLNKSGELILQEQLNKIMGEM